MRSEQLRLSLDAANCCAPAVTFCFLCFVRKLRPGARATTLRGQCCPNSLSVAAMPAAGAILRQWQPACTACVRPSHKLLPASEATSVVFAGLSVAPLPARACCRSHKAEHLQHNPCVEICIYAHKTSEQFRIRGKLTVIGPGQSDEVSTSCCMRHPGLSVSLGECVAAGQFGHGWFKLR